MFKDERECPLVFARAYVRAHHYTICLFFAFTAFTELDNSLSMSRLSVKANPVKEVKDEVFLAFTHNSLMLCDLSHRVKA